MRGEKTIQDIDLWEAWIDYDPSDARFFGMLYVFGEVWAGAGSVPIRLERDEQAPKGILALRIPERTSNRLMPVEVHYAEPVENLNQYQCICIYSGEDLVLSFDDIEVLI